MAESPLTVRADMSKRAELSMTFEAARITRYWPAREATDDKPARAFRIEVLLDCAWCVGWLGFRWRTFVGESGFGKCLECDGERRVWKPLHWVEQEESNAGAHP
jgi:hypothetical protein